MQRLLWHYWATWILHETGLAQAGGSCPKAIISAEVTGHSSTYHHHYWFTRALASVLDFDHLDASFLETAKMRPEHGPCRDQRLFFISWRMAKAEHQSLESPYLIVLIINPVSIGSIKEAEYLTILRSIGLKSLLKRVLRWSPWGWKKSLVKMQAFSPIVITIIA